MGDNEGKIKLLSFWSSLFVARVRLALELKGLQYELVEEEDLVWNKSQLLLESNPVHKKVPVLIHNGKAICESMIIVQYLDEVWPEDGTRPGFLPKEPYSRAMARFWVDFVDNKLFESGRRIMYATGEEDRARAHADFTQNCVVLEEVLSKNEEGPFFGGNEMGYVDIALSILANANSIYVEVLGIRFPDSQQCPRLHNWMQVVSNSPAVKAVFPDPEKLKDYLKLTIQRLKQRMAAA